MILVRTGSTPDVLPLASALGRCCCLPSPSEVCTPTTCRSTTRPADPSEASSSLSTCWHTWGQTSLSPCGCISFNQHGLLMGLRGTAVCPGSWLQLSGTTVIGLTLGPVYRQGGSTQFQHTCMCIVQAGHRVADRIGQQSGVHLPICLS